MGRAAAVCAVVLVLLAGGAQIALGLSGPAYRATAERVCTGTNARLAALPAPHTADEIRGWVTRSVPIVVTSTSRLRALSPPEPLRARHRAWSRALTRRAAAARALRDGVTAGAPPVAALADALPRLEALRRTARARAAALGLRTCAGRPPG